MLLHKNRLLKKKDFEAVARRGNTFSASNIVLKARENGLEKTRIGIAAGLKFSPKATERNRIKRQIKEIMREEVNCLRKGLDIIIIPRKGREKIDKKNLFVAIQKALKKGNLITSKK